MHAVVAFNVILVSLVAIIVLQLVAKRINLPPAAALLIGGIAMAFIPGIPSLTLDPELVLVLFLPPLLMAGAYFTVWHDLKRHLVGVLLLAVGAVLFTTLVVGVVAHLVMPSLPWAVCFALGAIVSPPDAVAAKAVLEHLSLPRRLTTLLEGESLLNDATGLVLVRFAVAAATTGVFSIVEASGTFLVLSIGGVVLGVLAAALALFIIQEIEDESLVIIITMLSSWLSYIAGEFVGVSGVIATVTCGIVVGWFQHEVLSATVRMRGGAFWQIVTFVLEALIFLLIGLSLRGVLVRLGGLEDAAASIGPFVATVVGAVLVSRFVWVYGAEAIKSLRGRTDWRGATVLGWAGMRGVVTLAIALALPEDLPGRDAVLVAAFAVILVTVLVQGTTLGLVIRAVGLVGIEDREPEHLSETQAWARLEAAQFAAIEPLTRNADGEVIHPRLLEQYTYRAELSKKLGEQIVYPRDVVVAHFDVVLAGIDAARRELVRLHREGLVRADLLMALERDLDLQEVGARHSRG